jgi:hypothetical protein
MEHLLSHYRFLLFMLWDWLEKYDKLTNQKKKAMLQNFSGTWQSEHISIGSI